MENDAGVQHAINAVMKDVWSGLHHHDDDADGECDSNEESEKEGEGEKIDSQEGENIEDEWDNWDDDENGISPLHMLGEDFERQSAASGKCT
jgi:hypothetical protein